MRNLLEETKYALRHLVGLREHRGAALHQDVFPGEFGAFLGHVHVTHGTPSLLHEEVGFTGERIAERIESALRDPALA